MKKRAKAPKAKKTGKSKKSSKKESCKSTCGCNSGAKWEECCGRCALPC